MATFLFYPFLTDGACLSFTSAVLPDDATALRHALRILADHSQADRVDVWEGERWIGARRRTTPVARVLIVEDSFIQADTYRTALFRAGFDEVLCCGSEAAGVAALSAARPDVALIDINLGDGPSFELAEALEAEGVPFAFLTGYDLEALPPRWRHAPYLCKPATGALIVEACRELAASKTACPTPHSSERWRFAAQPSRS